MIEQIGGASLAIDFLILNNGSTDHTNQVLDKIHKPSNVYFLSKSINEGYGAGIKFGIQNTNTPFIGWMHGDLQQDIALLENPEVMKLVNGEDTGQTLAVKVS